MITNFSHSKRLKTLLSITAVISLALVLISLSFAKERRTLPTLKRSDVAFSFGQPDDPEIVAAYGGTWMASYGDAPNSADSVDQLRKRIEKYHKMGLRYAAGFGMIHTFREMIDMTPYFLDAVCTDLRGNKLTTWMTHWSYKGHPAYYMLDIHPLFKKYVDERVRWTVRSNPDVLHFDDPFGCALVAIGEGAFNKQYMEGFREFLKQYVPKDTIEAHGINDLEHFDYGDFLREIESKEIEKRIGSSGYDLGNYDYEKYRMEIGSFPLIEYYQCYVYRCAIENTLRIKKIAREEAGRDVPMSGNAAYGDWDRLAFSPAFDYLSCELSYYPTKGLSAGGPILDYKVGETLETPIAAIGYGDVWAFIEAHNATGLAKGWIAECYAFGHNLVVPYHIWCRSPELLDHSYTAPPEVLGPIYRFIRANARFFDDYESVCDAGLLLSFANHRRNNKALTENAVALANLNVPFGVPIAGEPVWLDYIQLSQEDLDKYSVLIIPEKLNIDAKQKKVLDAWGVKNRVIVWRGEEDFLTQYTSPVQVSGVKNVRAIPRMIPGNAAAPVVCHLLNRNYNQTDDSYNKCGSFTVSIDNSLFKGRTFSKATMLPYGSARKNLNMETRNGKMAIQIPELDIWALVVLE